VLLRDGQVFLGKRCPDHGWFEGLIYADARAYVEHARFNKPGQAPARISTQVSAAAPSTAGSVPSTGSTPASRSWR